MRRLVLLAALLTTPCLAAWSQQDLPSSSGVFIDPPRNPPARRSRTPAKRAQHTQGATQEREGSGVAAGEERTRSDGAADPAEAVEDALWLGNAARDSTPPRYEEAERAYRLAARLAPKDPRPHIGLGNLLYDQKKFKEAAVAYRTAAQVSGPYSERIATELRRRERAERTEERALGGRRRRSRTRAIRQASEEERFLYTSAALLGQESAYMGAALIQQGKLAEAETELRKATLKNPANAEWWALLGTAQLAQRKYVSARRSLRSAVSLEPDNEKYIELLSQTIRRPKR